MRAIKAIELSKSLGIPRRTIAGWCQAQPELAFKRNGIYYIRVSELAKKPGFDMISALMLGSAKWIRATDLALVSGRSRRTISYWCATRSRFAKRIGRSWFIDLEALGATEEQVETLKQWAPNSKTAIGVLSAAAFLNKVLD